MKVFQSGCLGGCEQGPMAVSYPDGTLMMGVKPEDLEQILENALETGPEDSGGFKGPGRADLPF